MNFIASSYFIEVLGGENVDLEMQNFVWEALEKVSKPFFRAVVKTRKIIGKISSKLEVLKRGEVKIALTIK
jgi:hypothetical protein